MMGTTDSSLGQPDQKTPSLQDKFDTWIIENPKKARELDLPDEFLKLLVPTRVHELSTNDDSMDVFRFGEDKDETSIMAVERSCPHELTNPEIWQDWLSAIEDTRRKMAGQLIKVLPEAPSGVDRLHARFRNEIESGKISLTDRILMTCRMRVLPENPLTLYVGDFDGETHKGIGSDFYNNTLPNFARKLGFRYIIGQNNARNISFFVGTLGRTMYRDIKPEYRSQLFPSSDFQTIQFLYPEDRDKFVIQAPET